MSTFTRMSGRIDWQADGFKMVVTPKALAVSQAANTVSSGSSVWMRQQPACSKRPRFLEMSWGVSPWLAPDRMEIMDSPFFWTKI